MGTYAFNTLLCLLLSTRAYIFFYSALSAEKKKNLLCELCDFSEAGGEKHALTYTQSKTGPISIAEGLMHLIKASLERNRLTISFPIGQHTGHNGPKPLIGLFLSRYFSEALKEGLSRGRKMLVF